MASTPLSTLRGEFSFPRPQKFFHFSRLQRPPRGSHFLYSPNESLTLEDQVPAEKDLVESLEAEGLLKRSLLGTALFADRGGTYFTPLSSATP
jgi:hypothetical protein